MIIIAAAVSSSSSSCSSSSSSSSRIIHYWKSKSSVVMSNNTHNTHQPFISAFQVMMNTNTNTSNIGNNNEVIIDSMDRALSMIQKQYPEEYYHSTISHHHFVQTAPPSIREVISKFVWTIFY